MQELIKIEATPAHIAGNFDEVEAQLTEYLKQYDVVVTADTVADAKKLATELNKQIGELDRRIKDALAEAGAPIKEADERRKQLVKLGQDVRIKIKEQVDRFEDETRKLAGQLLGDLREKLWIEHAVSDEFKSAEYSDLIKLTAVTKKSNLSKAVTDELANRVRDDKSLQDRTERRIAELARASYESGLIAPIERQHVEHFLFDDDEQFKAKLLQVLDTEIERQQKAEQRMRDQAEREAQQKAKAEQQEAERQQRLREQKEQAQAATSDQQHERFERTLQETTEQLDREVNGAPLRAGNAQALSEELDKIQDHHKASSDGKETWHVVMTFEVRVPAGTTGDAIKAEARRILPEQALKTLKTVTAQKTRPEAA